MPTRNEIRDNIMAAKAQAQDNIRREYLRQLHEHTGRDTIIYASAFSSPKLPNVPNFLINITTEDIQGFMSALHGLKGAALDLIIHSPGGSLEATDQIVQYLRMKYKIIRAIVPQNAMSAATMLCCACDSIVMGKHSAIGPIDPQITFPTKNGHFTAPAQAILDEFDQAKQEVMKDPRTAPLWIRRIEAYPHGFLKICEDTIALSVEKVSEWLDMYMFKETSGPEKRGGSIAAWLGNAREHKTHGRPINIATARSIGLKVEALEDDQELQEKVLSVFHASVIAFDITNCMKFVENHNGRGSFWHAEIKK